MADFYRDYRAHVELVAETIGAADDGHDGIEMQEEYAAVRRALARLGERDREILLLAFFDELDGQEIALTLECTPNNAYVRLHRALKKLRVLLNDEMRGKE